jgi:hypothetical protein
MTYLIELRNWLTAHPDVVGAFKVIEILVVLPLLALLTSTMYLNMSSRNERLRPERIRQEYKDEIRRPDSYWYKSNRDSNIVYLSALGGVALVATTQLLQASKLDLPLTISIYAFAFAIPLLAGEILIQRQMSLYKYAALTDVTFLAQVGLFIATIGVASLFFHFSWFTGVLFGVGSGLVYGSLSKWLAVAKAINEENNHEDSQTSDQGTASIHQLPLS